MDTVSTFRLKESGLDILVCNAGVIEREYKVTEDDIEMDFQVNYFGMHLVFGLCAFGLRLGG
jgi:NAD(P)-dependent dehydrogenase (short-subunit alcohol dehydrogenase family)